MCYCGLFSKYPVFLALLLQTSQTHLQGENSLLHYGEDVSAAADLEKDDFVLVTVAKKAIQTIAPVETVNKTTITNFSTKDYLTAAGTKYEYSDGAS